MNIVREEIVMKVSLYKLKNYYCPIDSCIWRVDPPISFQEVRERLNNNQFEQEPLSESPLETPLNYYREKHIRRIAYLAGGLRILRLQC